MLIVSYLHLSYLHVSEIVNAGFKIIAISMCRSANGGSTSFQADYTSSIRKGSIVFC